MDNSKCPQCGFQHTVFSMNTKPWKCKCGIMLKSSLGWKKLLITAGVLLLIKITAQALLGIRIPTVAAFVVLVVIATQSTKLEEVPSRESETGL